MKQLQYIVSVVIACLFVAPLYGQQDAEYSQYMFNHLAINPAYAGSKDNLSATLLTRHQWLNVPGAPSTQTLGIHAPTMNKRHGMGGNFIVDRLGITTQLILEGTYAYRVPVGKGNLAMGIKVGAVNVRNDWSRAVGYEVDNMAPTNVQSVVVPRAGTGLYYSSNKFYVGVSVPNFIPNKYKYQTAISLTNLGKEEIHLFATTGVLFRLSEQVKLKPSLMMKWVNNAPVEFDVNANIYFRDRLGFGMSYRTGDALVFMIEYFHSKFFRVGYAYDLTLTRLRQVTTGSHELMLGFDLEKSGSKVLSPRYF